MIPLARDGTILQSCSRTEVALVLLGWQVVAFTTGVVRGPAAGPYPALYRALVLPRIGRPSEMEDAAPPRFAQGVGLAFTAVALVGFLAGLDGLGIVATAMALAAALLNAVFGICLGCKLFVLGMRVLRPGRMAWLED